MDQNTVQNIVKDINKARLAAKGQWWTYVNLTHGMHIKGYQTWIQIIQTPTYKDSGPMDLDVAGFKAWLTGYIGEVYNPR